MTGVLVVDGGQSGIRARHNSDPRVVEVEGVSRSEGDVVAAVAERVAQAWRELGSPPTQRVGLGLTTASPAAAERMLDLVATATGASEAWLSDDTITTHAGALASGWGVVLVAGTGVACLAVPESGDPLVIDGHGYLLGDDGGGFWIGREGIRAALRFDDGRGPDTALVAAAQRAFGDLTGLPARVHDLPRAVNAIAQFAPEVLALAASDDVAAGILDRAADALTETVAAGVAHTLASATGDAPSPVALGGRLLDPASSPLRSRLDERLAARVPLALPRDAAAGPLEGALLVDADPHRYASLIHRLRKEPTHV